MARPIGSPNKKTNELRLDLLATLREKGFDPAAKMIEAYTRAETLYKKRLNQRNGFGVVGLIKEMRECSQGLMSYVYPELKAVELTGKDGRDVFQSFTAMIKQIADGE